MPARADGGEHQMLKAGSPATDEREAGLKKGPLQVRMCLSAAKRRDCHLQCGYTGEPEGCRCGIEAAKVAGQRLDTDADAVRVSGRPGESAYTHAAPMPKPRPPLS